ncbi:MULTISPECIES: carbohydrate ABC transporter permease [Phyllobacteriaceae]|nr:MULTISPECIES: sugar ABC transporter permease [Phyllobacteriaceae]WEX12247.1 sugar ABC transporter permease [Chelativorans sp. AA-79]
MTALPEGNPEAALHGQSRAFRRYVLLPPTSIISALMVFAFLSLVYYALHEVDIYTLVPTSYVGWRNFTFIFSDPKSLTALLNTFIWIGVSVVLITILGIATGLFLSRDGAIIRFTRAFMLVPWVLPGVVTAALFRWFFQTQNGIFNSTLAQIGFLADPVPWLSSPGLALYTVCFAIVWRLFPMFALVTAAAIKTVDQSLYDAAAIDGASAWRRFWHITLPGITQQTLTMVLLVTIWVANNLVFVHVMTGGGPIGQSETIPTYIYRMAFDVGNVGLASAASLLNAALLVIIGIVYVRALRAARRES